MKKVFITFLSLSLAISALAQYPGNANDWIDFDKTYYKFKIGEEGIYRITGSELTAAGFSGNGSEVQLIRDGEEVPVYVSTNGPLTATDFVEFYGYKNDGKMDTPLYEDPDWQPSTDRSLFDDRATYFLTLNSGANQRYVNAINDVTNPPAREEYYLAKSLAVDTRFVNGRPFRIGGGNLYESIFDYAEGFAVVLRRNAAVNIATPNVYTSASEDVELLTRFTRVFSTSKQGNRVSFKLGNGSFQSFNWSGGIQYYNERFTFPKSDLTGGSTRVSMTSDNDFYYVGKLEIKYPRNFDFSGQNFVQIETSLTGERYFEIKNLSDSGREITILDLSNNSRFTENYSSTLKFKSLSNSSNNFVISNNFLTAGEITAKKFVDYSLQNPDYLVIYNKSLSQPLNGVNYVQTYVDYRSSSQGGGYNVLAIEISDIYDQFAYGTVYHSAAIKNLYKELSDNGVQAKHLFIIGKGYQYSSVINKEDFKDNTTPPFGAPATDNLYVSNYGQETLRTAVGRISATTTTDLKEYYNKIIEYEATQNDTSDPVQTKDKIWMKRALHLGGGSNQSQQNAFKFYLNNYKAELESDNYGANVTSVFKTSTDPIQLVESVLIDSLIDNGISLVTFFGHAAPNVFEFNLRDPGNYENQGKYPLIITNGCYVGNLFSTTKTLSEDFVLEPNKGSIAFMGPIQFGIAPGMNGYSQKFYENLSRFNYQKSVGENIQLALNQSLSSSIISRLTSQQMIFHGDPAIRLNTHEKPDYLIDASDVTFEPSVITADDETFDVIVDIFNIGKGVREDVPVTITRFLPDGTEIVQTELLSDVLYNGELRFTFDTDALSTAGLNEFMIEIDEADGLDEITRANNKLGERIAVSIVANTVTPVYPYEFAITNDNDLELKASSVQIYAQPTQFKFEIDTTEQFNSPLKQVGAVSSRGGLIKWKPTITFEDKRVYYWRTKVDEADAIWSNSSFIYHTSYSHGWNQSHYYQYLKDQFGSLQMDASRKLQFANNNRFINVQTGISPPISRDKIAYALDGDVQYKYTCHAGFVVVVFDENTGIPLRNTRIGNRLGKYNSYLCTNRTMKAFPFRTTSSGWRQRMVDMLNHPDLNGKYVMVYNNSAPNPIAYDWASDTGFSVFDTFENYGASQIRTLPDNAPYLLFFKKASDGSLDNTFPVIERAGTDRNTIIDENITISGNWSFGELTTPLIGRSAAWDTFEWAWNNSLDNDPTGDVVTVDIIGVEDNGDETELFSDITATSVDISGISVGQYPFLQLRFKVQDPVNFTPVQLEYWRIIYKKVPELAINADKLYEEGQTILPRGKPLDFSYAIENISDADMTPVLVKYTGRFADNTSDTQTRRYNDLPAGETQDLSYSFDTDCACQHGINTMLIDVNPDDDQPEQYHFNNIALIEYEVERDRENPYLDVTFDGIHIIDGDVIAETPNIIITLEDENNYLALDRPEDFKIHVQEPGVDTLTIYTINSPEITFFPADPNNLENANRAVIEFNPTFKPGEYSMIVQGKDRSENNAGDLDYKISFEVTDEDRITRIVNYPNPFSTRTEFIADIVGDAPDLVLIQIFATNGRVIKEIRATPSDLSVSAGNNFMKIAEWDGRDDYGDPVGNGIYYYKVTMKRNGEIIQPNEDEDLDKNFYNGLGKLVILR